MHKKHVIVHTPAQPLGSMYKKRVAQRLLYIECVDKALTETTTTRLTDNQIPDRQMYLCLTCLPVGVDKLK